MKRIKVIRGYTNLARFLHECDDTYTVLHCNIPTPYTFTTTRPILIYKQKRIIILETAHRRYEAYEIDPYDGPTETMDPS